VSCQLLAHIFGFDTHSYSSLFSFDSYATTFVGSSSFMAFALYAYQTNKAAERSATYFRGRLIFYTVLLSVAGLSQLMLGSYVIANFGGGPLAAPVIVVVYVVFFPEITIFVGIIQLLTGIFGVFRRFGKFNNGKDDHRYQMALFFTWICMLTMQIVSQIAYAPAATAAAAAPTVACLSLALCAAPAFLDYKMRTLPEVFPAEYYGMPTTAHGEGDKSEEAVFDVEEPETEKAVFYVEEQETVSAAFHEKSDISYAA
jgi:hypothetical protein